jgi:3-hydroxyisobutyrate dehydrogenase-like beta-hydroxyacid dehydrogenase
LEFETLGFVGVGKMGGPLATRLLEAGHRLVVHDSDARAVETLVERGAASATSPAAVATAADIVLICLPTPSVVRDVTLGPSGLIEGGRVRTVIDMGTTGPVVSREIAAALLERGILHADSPVTGGVNGAVNGTLAIILSCPDRAFEDVSAVVGTFGRVYRVGTEAGQAQVAKLANNLLSAAALAVTSEAMAFGTKAGLDPQLLIEIINAGSGRNSATEDKFPKAILPGTYDFGMKTGLFLKDIRLCLAEAEALGVPMVVGEAVRQLFAITQARRGFSSDFTRIAEVVANWSDDASVAGSR